MYTINRDDVNSNEFCYSKQQIKVCEIIISI